MDDARITVILPAHDASKTVAAAIQSILDQTYGAFELIVIDDHSSDTTPEAVNAFHDGRIRFERNSDRLGLPRSLNRGIALARTEYVARMDADDISLPRRFERQVAFMDQHPEVGACGTWARTAGHRAGRLWRTPISPDDAAAALLFSTPLIHPSVMIRRAPFVQHGLTYDPRLEFASEDWDLWTRAFEHMRLANIPEVLFVYHVRDPALASDVEAHGMWSRKRQNLSDVVERVIGSLGIRATPEEVQLHAAICLTEPLADQLFLKAVESWLLRLQSINATARVYPVGALERQIALQWFWICYACARRGRSSWQQHWKSPLANWRAGTPRQLMGFALASLAAVLKQR